MAKVYFFMALVCGVIAYFSTYGRPAKLDTDGVIQKNRQRTFFYLLLLAILIIFSGFRQLAAGGMDEYAYRNRFSIFQDLSLLGALEANPMELLMSLTMFLSTRLFDVSQGFLLLSSIVILLPMITSFKKYSIDFAYAIVLLFVTTQLYNSFNGIAQYLAAAIYLFAIPYIYKRQFWKYVLVVAMCCMFHMGAIVLFPIYFIAMNRADSLKGIFTSVIVLSAIIVAYGSLESIINVTGMLDDYMFVVEEGHHGVNIITITINCVPAALALYASRYIKDDKITTICGNMCILHALIYIASTMDVYIARFAIFTCTFVILYLSRITKIFSNDFKIIFKIGSVALYSIVCYLHISGAKYFFNFYL